MPDVYSTIAEADSSTLEKLAEVLELRAADPQQRTMLESYLSEIPFPDHARVLEIGCGTGPFSQVLATWPGVGEVVGVDPSPFFIAKARDRGASQTNLTFVEADGRDLPLTDAEFDVVVFHTVLTHVPFPEQGLAEAFRVVRSGGTVIVFDGDYATITVATGDFDPLQNCIEATKKAFINDSWLVRKLPSLLQSAGFDLVSTRSHGYMRIEQPDYLQSLVDRGADTLLSWGRIGPELCFALKSEARRRVDTGDFFGFIGYASLIARKPDESP